MLRSRLLPPQLPSACVPRTTLVAAIAGRRDARLITVVAGAGYGKTTLLRLILERIDCPWVWCSCDERLSDGALLRHLAAGFAERYPGFGARLSPAAPMRDQVEDFCNEVVETVDEDVLVLLDDVHLLADPTMVVVDGLLRDLPAVAHLVLAGREPMPLTLGRLRPGRILQVGEPDLMFSEEESAMLLEAVGPGLGPEEASRLHGEVEGWAAGLIMAAQSGGGEAGAELEYLAEEVLLRQPPDVQWFLLASSILDRFTPALAAAVTERADAANLVRELVDRHLFTVRLQDGHSESYRYHHLFQAFLRTHLARVASPETVGDLHRRAASALLLAGERVDAVPHLLAAGEHTAAADTLESVAETLVTTPHALTLAGWLDAMPAGTWSTRPSLITANAALLLARGEHEASFDEFERAIDRLLELGDDERAAAVLLRLLQSMITAGTRPARRIEAAERYTGRVRPFARALPVVRILLASSYAYACRFEQAARELREALELPGAGDQPILGVYAEVVDAYYIRAQVGQLEERIVALDEAIDKLARLEPEDELGFMPYARMFRVYLLNDLGRHDDALVEIARTQEAAARRGMTRTHRRVVSWIRGVALAGLERWDELEREIAPPGRASGKAEPTSYSYRYRALAAQLAAVRGDAAVVRSHVAAACDEMAAFGPAFDKPMVLCDLARAARRAGEDGLAIELASQARDIAGEIGAPWGLARSCMNLAAGTGESGDEALAEALRLTERWSFTALWRDRERSLAGALLARAMERGLGPPGRAARVAAACGAEVFRECVDRAGDAPVAVRAQLAEVAGDAVNVEASVVERLLRDPDPTVRTAARRARAHLDARPRPAIRLLTLGRFSVTRDGVPVPEAAFGRQKARALLGMLLAARGPVHREQLSDWLWPDAPPERGLAGLRVALHGLRRGLAPELDANATASPVVADGEAVRLLLGEHDEWDVATFLDIVRSRSPDPQEEIGRLERAEALYAGPFLPEWPYADWAAQTRRELEERSREVLERLAAALAGVGRLHEAIRRYRLLVVLEPEREAWHRALMSCHARAGERAEALRQYHACRTVLRREQGVAPGPETASLYQSILAETEP